MEFFCVFSVGGSLATYQVQQEGEQEYKAIVKTAGAVRDDIPAAISLTKAGDTWQAQPWHEEVVFFLLQAIEANGR